MGSKKDAGPLRAAAHNMVATLQDELAKAAQPLLRPLIGAFRQFTGFIRQITPELRAMFAAAVPMIRPLVTGLESLVRGLLPGLVTMLRASRPAFAAVASILGTLGRDLGAMFRAFAPAMRPSSVILKALASTLGALLPVIGRLAAMFARVLAPVFTAFAGTLRQLMPFLLILGRVLASFASAVLTDLVAAFGALATLLRDLAPSFRILAAALSRVFTIMESAGVFGALSSALEQIAPVLARLVNTIIRQLAPILPVIIGLVSQFASVLITLLAAGLETILSFLNTLLRRMPFLVPTIAAITAAWLAWNLVMDANPIGAIILATVALVGAITLLARHWRQVWGWIRDAASAAWHFIYDGFGKWLLPLLGPAGLIALGAIELARHWRSIWSGIRQVAANLWQWLWNDFGAKIFTFFTKTIPRWWDQFFTAVRNTGSDVVAWFRALPGRIIGALEGLGTDLYNFGHMVLVKMGNGIKAAWNGVVGFFRGLPHAILHALGIASPPDWAIDAGRHIMGGILKGLAHGGNVREFFVGLASDILGPLKSAWAKLTGLFSGDVTGGAAQWANTVMQALRMEHLPLSLTRQVLYQIGTESGGNPQAINLTDINAQMGDPSKGLLQVIGSTFRAFHWPGTSWDIYNPLANIAAAINYARWRYGPRLMIGGAGLGSGHGYDAGGWLLPGTTVAVNRTTQPELVLTPAQSQAVVAAGGPARGSHGKVADTLVIQLPEGTTIAEALREIGWQLRVARQQAWAGVPG
jgi:phage-related protein